MGGCLSELDGCDCCLMQFRFHAMKRTEGWSKLLDRQTVDRFPLVVEVRVGQTALLSTLRYDKSIAVGYAS
jgi:hypothetical protein